MTTEERSGVEGVEGVGCQAAAAGPGDASERICPDCHTYMCGSATRDEDRCQAAIIAALRAALAAAERRAEEAAKHGDLYEKLYGKLVGEVVALAEVMSTEFADATVAGEDAVPAAIRVLRSERAAREKAELEFLAAVFERDEEKLNTALAESRLSRAVEALREIDAKIGHFAGMEVTEFPHALIPLVARTVKAVLAEVGK